MDFIVGIRAETGNYRGLSSIYEHFPKIKPHEQGRIENYQEFRHAYIGVTFGIFRSFYISALYCRMRGLSKVAEQCLNGSRSKYEKIAMCCG